VQDYTNAYLSRSAFVQLANAEAVLKLRIHVSSKNALGCVLICNKENEVTSLHSETFYKCCLCCFFIPIIASLFKFNLSF